MTTGVSSNGEHFTSLWAQKRTSNVVAFQNCRGKSDMQTTQKLCGQCAIGSHTILRLGRFITIAL